MQVVYIAKHEYHSVIDSSASQKSIYMYSYYKLEYISKVNFYAGSEVKYPAIFNYQKWHILRFL